MTDTDEEEEENESVKELGDEDDSGNVKDAIKRLET